MPGGLETELDRELRESEIMLDAREAFFLGGGDQLAVPEESRGGIVIKTGQAQDVHQNCLLKSSRSAGILGLGVQ